MVERNSLFEYLFIRLNFTKIWVKNLQNLSQFIKLVLPKHPERIILIQQIFFCEKQTKILMHFLPPAWLKKWRKEKGHMYEAGGLS